MKIKVALNAKSIKDAKKQILDIKKVIPQMNREFMTQCCKWIIEKAKWYVENSDIGSMVKTDINTHWSYIVTDNSAKITNDSDKAVFVEFGVGIVGQGNPHPNASSESYNYNIPSKSKDENGMWYFWTNSNELDLPFKAVEDIRGFLDYRGASGKRIVVGTRGAEGLMYAYQAIVDARQDLRNPNGDLPRMWKEIKARYIG